MSLQDQLDALNLLIPANDEVSEPFQPIPTWERWKTEDLMANREGTVIRSGLYLKDRKDIAEAMTAVNDDANEKISDEATNRINADQDLNNRVIVLENSAGAAVSSVNTKTGAVVLTADDITIGSGSTQTINDSLTTITTSLGGKADSATLGTAAKKDTGTAVGNVPILGTGGKLDPAVIPDPTPNPIDVPETPLTLTNVWHGSGTYQIRNGILIVKLTGVKITPVPSTTDPNVGLKAGETETIASIPNLDNTTAPLLPQVVASTMVTPTDTSGASGVYKIGEISISPFGDLVWITRDSLPPNVEATFQTNFTFMLN